MLSATRLALRAAPVVGTLLFAPAVSVAQSRCVPDNRSERVFAEIGGYYLGVLVAATPLIVMSATNSFSGEPLGMGAFTAAVSTAIVGTFTGALGAWGFGRLLGGDGGYGSTWLGGFLGLSVGGFGAGPGAAIGFELSTSPTCRDYQRPQRAQSSRWFVAPAVDPTGPSTRYGLTLNVSL